MNITSYNITEVSYHYIGLRVLGGVPASIGRRHQFEAISRGVLKFVNDRALRLMLPEPRGTFETIGEKICQELVHLQLASSSRLGYELTESGNEALCLLASRKYRDLRRLMISRHLQTYDNLRAVLNSHFDCKDIWRPIVESKRLDEEGYIEALLEPTFGPDEAANAVGELNGRISVTPKKIESLLHTKIIGRVIANQRIGVPLFRAICDRLTSLRLLNIQRVEWHGCEFMKSYSPCAIRSPSRAWYSSINIQLTGELYTIYLCEPDMSNESHQIFLSTELDRAFSELSPEGGYYDIPQLRDLICERLMIPEASFDEGINRLLDKSPRILSVGLRYDRISGRRKPLVRDKQIHNVIRKV